MTYQQLLQDYQENRPIRVKFLRFFQKWTALLSALYLGLFVIVDSWTSFSAVFVFSIALLVTFYWQRQARDFRSALLLSILFNLVPPICVTFSGGISSPYTAWLITPVFAAAGLIGRPGLIIATTTVGFAYLAMFLGHDHLIALNELHSSYVQNLRFLSDVSAMIFLCAFAWKNLSDLRQHERDLSALNNHQAKLFSIIGHELRTPAASIDMLIDEKLRQNKDSTIAKELKDISGHLLSILDEMKMATPPQIEAPVNTAMGVFSVFELLEQSIRGIRWIHQSNQFLITLHGSKIWPHGHIGPAKNIRQIIQNLLKNAILHSGGNTITVTMNFAHLANQRTRFTITVADNGKGIDKNFINVMYQAFERGNTAASGSGLGLHICKVLAEMLPDGDLTYRDNPAGGAIFELTFSLDKNHPAQDSHHEVADDICVGKHVLLVEDTATLRLTGKIVLENEGAHVVTAEHGGQALTLMADYEPDVVLTDIMMPEMDGYAFTRALRAQGFTKPIIGITAATIGKEAEELLACGADRVLSKPLMINDLKSALRSVLGRRD